MYIETDQYFEYYHLLN